jgi:hypothetical protein
MNVLTCQKCTYKTPSEAIRSFDNWSNPSSLNRVDTDKNKVKLNNG